MAILKAGRANVIIDGQWGSTGKGKLAGYLCATERPDMVICDYMPNAGHVFVEDDGAAMTFCQLPVGVAFGIPSYLGPHASVNVDLFMEEIKRAPNRENVKIHPLATVITDSDKDEEQAAAGRIANTAKGGHSATVRKIMRSADAQLAYDNPHLRPFIADVHKLTQDALFRGEKVLIETAQGFDLGLNHGTSYPYVTGRDCLIGRALDNAGVPVSMVGSIIASLRTYPIRVGNTVHGESGPYYHDQKEITWEEVSRRAGFEVKPELTTVTKRVRRVFTFSHAQLDRFLRYVRPTHAFLNFCNYWNEDTAKVMIRSIASTMQAYNCNLCLYGTGAKNSDMKTSWDV